MQVKLEAMAVHGRHRRQRGPLTSVTSGRIGASTSVAITMAACTPSGPGQHDRDGEHNGAGNLGEVAAGSNDRTCGSASLSAGAARPGKRRYAAPPPRRSPTNQPSLPAVNRDASLFLVAVPDTGPSGQHASADRAGFAASVGPLRATSAGAPVWSNRRRSRSARDRSSRTRRPGSHTARTQTDGQTPGSDRHRRRGVDQPRPRQDTRPACVLPGTVWGAASGQNCQVEPGAVLTLNSASRPLGRRGARCLGYSPRPRRTANTASAPDHVPTRAAAAPRPTHQHATEADNDHHGRTEVAGSIQMSKPGSIRVSAEV
jgi:hypothetical protein